MDPPILFATIGTLGLIGVAAKRLFGAWSSPTATLWKKYAQKRGYEWVPPGSRLEERFPQVREAGPARAWFDVHEVRGAGGARLHTRVAAQVEAPSAAVVHVETRAAERRSRLERIATTDAAFDEEFVAASNEPAVGGRVLDDEMRSRMLALPTKNRGLMLTYEAGHVVLSWEGVEDDPAMLDAALAVVEHVARWRGAVGYR